MASPGPRSAVAAVDLRPCDTAESRALPTPSRERESFPGCELRQNTCRLLLFFFSQLDFGGVKFLLDARYVGLVDFGGDGAIPFDQGALPVCGSQLQAAGFLIKVAEVVVHGRV